jgi:hypothetical protein
MPTREKKQEVQSPPQVQQPVQSGGQTKISFTVSEIVTLLVLLSSIIGAYFSLSSNINNASDMLKDDIKPKIDKIENSLPALDKDIVRIKTILKIN